MLTRRRSVRIECHFLMFLTSAVNSIDLQLLTKSPNPNRMMVRRTILTQIVIGLTWRCLRDRNEITIETPMIHINLVKQRFKEIHDSFLQSFNMLKLL